MSLSAALFAVVAACSDSLTPTGPCPLPAKTPAERPVELGAGELLHVRVEALGVDLRLQLARPDGTRLRRANERFSGEGVEELFWIAESPEKVVFSVRPLAGAGGAYRILEVERWVANADDRRRVAVIAEGLEMGELYGAATPEASRELATRGPLVADRLAAEGFTARALAVLHQRARGLREDLGDPEGASAAFRELAERARILGEPSFRANALTFLAIDEKQRGDLDVAGPLLVEAIAEARRGDDRAVLADTLGVYAGWLDLLGRSRESVAAQRESIALQGELGRVESVALARSNLGSTLFRSGALDEAEAEFVAAEATLRRLGKQGELALAIANLAAVLIEKGSPRRAAEILEEAVTIPVSTGTSDYRIRALLTLGNAYQELGLRDEAEARARDAEALARATDFPALVGLALEDRGENAFAAGDLESAAARYSESLAILRPVGDLERLSAVLARSAETARRRGERTRARVELDEALALAVEHDYPMRELDARVALARLARDEDDLPRALAEVRRAVEVIERLRATLGAASDRRSFLAWLRETYELEVGVELELDRRAPAAGHAEAAFAAAERGRARWLLDLLDPTASPSPGPMAAEVVDRVSQLRSVQRRLLALRDRPAADGERIRLEGELAAAARDFEAARAGLARARPTANGFAHAGSAITVAAIAAKLAPDEALLEYVIGDECAALFVVRRQGLTVHRLAPPAEIARAVAALLDEAGRTSALGAAAYRERAVAAYRLLVLPAAEALAGVKRLLISPDGPLYRLPFALLVEDGTGEATFGELAYLSLRFDLARLPSAAVWLELSRRPPAASPAPAGAVFGDPLLAASAAGAGMPPAARRGLLDFDPGTLGPLPGGREEATAVAREVTGMRLYIGSEASEARAKQDLEVARGRLLHFATHGLVSDRRPELSALLLAPDAAEDGLLQAWEVAELALESDLVVLSSCRSALGAEISGEGFVGLVQAFLEAGSRGVMAAFWPVGDRATADLMRAFYEGLARGDEPASALAGAQRARVAAGGLAAHPANWAAFELIGNPVSPVARH